jgi:hypothetical protein
LWNEAADDRAATLATLVLLACALARALDAPHRLVPFSALE